MKLRISSVWPALAVGAACTGISAFAAAEPSRLSFDAALQAIMNRSTAIGAQQATLDATQARAVPVRLTYLPTLSLDAKKGRQGSDGSSWSGSQVEALSSLNLFRFGGDGAANRAATADIQTQQATLDDTRLGTEENAIEALLSRTERAQEVAVDQRLVELQGELSEVARERYGRGLLAQQEVEKITVDMDNASARLVDARLGLVQADAALETLLGSADVATDWPWMKLFQNDAAVTALTGGDLSLSERPDWRTARARVDAEDARVSQATAAILPSFDASLAYGRYDGFLGLGGGYPAYTQWTGTLSVSVPLFDHLSNYSNSRAQRSVRTAAENGLEQVERQARSDWDAARSAFRVAVASAKARERTVAVSRRLFQDNLKRFQAGRIDANDLVLDESRLLDSELLAVQGWNAAHLAYSHLCHARGRRVGECGGQ